METAKFDFDWLVIGSGFGGSVSALRLSEKGYKVGVLERGRRFRDEDFAESTWQLGRFFSVQGCFCGQWFGCWRGKFGVCQYAVPGQISIF